MVILAIETVTRAGSIALWDHGQCHARVGADGRTHVERLPAEAFDWLAAHDRRIDDVDLFAVVCGPGSFTGLRIGIAAVQGLTLAGHRRVLGVSTLDALVEIGLDRTEMPALILPCLDGQRGDVFFSLVEPGRSGHVEDAKPLIEPSVASPDEVAEQVTALSAGRPVVAIGDGALRHAGRFREAWPGVEIATPHRPLAEAAVRMAARRSNLACAPHALRPLYIRRPDAELARDRARQSAPGRSHAAFVVRRAAGTTDLEGVEALQRETFTNPWGADAIRWELENTDVARLYVLQEPQGTLVAYCACWVVFDELHINSLAVQPSWRRQGLARHLLDEVLADASATGAASATLEVRNSNIAARELYQRLGFQVEGVRRDYYHDPREDALILWRRDLHAAR